MKFKKLKSQKEINVNISKYKVDWNKKVSNPQYLVKNFLYPFWKFDTVLEEFLIPGSRLRVDLINISQQVAIEISPESSHEFNPFFHKTRVGGFLGSFKRDLEKHEWLEQNGFECIELNSADIKNLSIELFKEKGINL